MPQGASPEREREYKELVSDFKEEGRYEGREEEVAARIVNKQRADYGETIGAREKDRQGESPDRDLPLANYEGRNIDEVRAELDGLSKAEIRQLATYEKKHLNRKTLLEEFEQRLE